MSDVRRIAILGGGVASLSTALELTSTPDWQTRYDITVYQMGWRLGGKGASSRNPAASGRIEEHGLHVWFGCYDHAFRLLRGCYDELGRPADAPFPTMESAFTPAERDAVFRAGRRCLDRLAAVVPAESVTTRHRRADALDLGRPRHGDGGDRPCCRGDAAPDRTGCRPRPPSNRRTRASSTG